MRLNRVPTSVRLASDLIKSSTPLSPPSHSGHSNQPSTSSSIGSPPPTSIVSGHRRELSSFSSLPSPPQSALSGEGASRPALSVPATPSATRNVTPEDLPKPVTAKEAAATAAMPPPTSFKPPNQPQPKSRPSLPAPTGFSPGALGEPFSGVSRHSKFRTSVHEATFSAPDFAGSPGPDSAPSSISIAAKRRSPFGLGLEMPPVPRHGVEAGSLMSSGTLKQAFEGGSKAGFAMDLAGMGTMGDASQHATMIMQSRQAKMQRWRPNSAGVSAQDRTELMPRIANSCRTKLRFNHLLSTAQRRTAHRHCWLPGAPLGRQLGVWKSHLQPARPLQRTAYLRDSRPMS